MVAIRQRRPLLRVGPGPAGAVVQQYASEDLETMFSLEVVRAKSPYPPYVQFTDPKDLGFDKPAEEVLEYGDVACARRTSRNWSTRPGHR